MAFLMRDERGGGESREREERKDGDKKTESQIEEGRREYQR
jgi:hypothetical protein